MGKIKLEKINESDNLIEKIIFRVDNAYKLVNDIINEKN